MFSRLKELLFKNQGARQIVVKNISWLISSQIIGRFIKLAIVIYAARALGAGQYGIFSYALSLAGFFTIFADIGVEQILTRDAAQKPRQASEYFATSFWIKTVLLVGATMGILLLAPHFSKLEGAKILLPYVALLVIFDNLRELCNAFFRAQEKMEREAIVNILTNVSITVFGFIILYYSKTSKGIVLAYLAGSATGALMAASILKNEFRRIINFFRKSLIKEILSAAWPIALFGGFNALAINIDILMLGWFKPAADLGFYSAGQKIVQIFYTLPSFIAVGLFPTLARFVKTGERERVRSLAENGMAVIYAFGIPLVVGGAILAKPIITLLYGTAYLPSVPVFEILIFSIPFVFAGPIVGNILLGYNKQKMTLVYASLASAFNVIFNAILIPPYGIIGATIATLISQFINNSLVWRYAKKLNDFYTLRYLKKIFIAVVPMGLSAYFFNYFGINIIINIAISGTIYFVTLYLIKEKLVEQIKSIIRAI